MPRVRVAAGAPYGDCGVMVARQIVALVVMVRIHTFLPLDKRYFLTFLKSYDIICIQKRKIIKLKLLKDMMLFHLGRAKLDKYFS